MSRAHGAQRLPRPFPSESAPSVFTHASRLRPGRHSNARRSQQSWTLQEFKASIASTSLIGRSQWSPHLNLNDPDLNPEEGVYDRFQKELRPKIDSYLDNLADQSFRLLVVRRPHYRPLPRAASSLVQAFQPAPAGRDPKLETSRRSAADEDEDCPMSEALPPRSRQPL